MKLNIYSETCCEDCYEIIHNHFDCPSCGMMYASTDVYSDFRDYWLINEQPKITCEHCNATYIIKKTIKELSGINLSESDLWELLT
jgi:predicted nucleic acid-binding Zn ribbon protein